MHDLDDEMNGIITTISNHNRAKRRKDAAAATAAAPTPPVSLELTVGPSSPCGSEPRLEATPPPKPTHWCLAALAAVRKVLRALYCCHVENPHHIDNYSRVTFPLSFVVVNLLYWTYYLYL
ncbi:Gamma-aminobutyric acid receptor subunit pi [Liparis tanakae]|uniref:Gamma-aminobutyric acid receptor subunit pi n=1 Tax=Liparis tanakae TaxID=230148 RepID=A0A4Z2FLI5_9TELE|nr:Gamma-aminobutyric acid receptor subunit pi [Liparis tanakae]